MQFLLLICLMTVCLPLDWPEPRFGIGRVGSLLFTGMTVCALLLAAGYVAQSSVWRLVRGRPRDAVARRYAALRQVYFFLTLTGYASCLLVFGWAYTAIDLGTIAFREREVLVPFGEVLILAPFFLVQVGSWAFFYDVDRHFYQSTSDARREARFWSRWGYVFFLFRQQMVLVLAPAVLMMAQQAVERMYPEALKEAWVPTASLLVLPAFLIFFPLLLPPLLGLRPLPAGPVRDRLKAHALRLRFRYSQIYLWDTRGSIANAMVVGIVPWIRYVVLTDRLLEELSPVEVDGVFGHEVGHVHHGHIVFYALFLMLSFVLLGALIQSLAVFDVRVQSEFRSFVMIAPVALMGVYMFAVFGFVSRRCERQADLFGCRAGSCETFACSGHDCDTPLVPRGAGLCAVGIANFVRALRRVEDINGMARTPLRWRGVGIAGKVHYVFRLLTGWLHTWQHSTIDKRVAFLQKVAERPELERRFQRRVFAVKCLVMAILVGGLVALGEWQGWGVLLLSM